METKWLKEKENLLKLILEEKLSYNKIGSLYGVTGSCIRKIAPRIGIELPSKRKINPKETFNKGKNTLKKCLNCDNIFRAYYKNMKYCSKKCSFEHKKKISYAKFLLNPKEFPYSKLNSIKPHILKEQNYRCSICNIESFWNGKPMVLILDHINGRSDDNRRENLRCICHNCDSQLPTYKSKNKNSDRNYIRYGGYKNKM